VVVGQVSVGIMVNNLNVLSGNHESVVVILVVDNQRSVSRWALVPQKDFDVDLTLLSLADPVLMLLAVFPFICLFFQRNFYVAISVDLNIIRCHWNRFGCCCCFGGCGCSSGCCC